MKRILQSIFWAGIFSCNYANAQTIHVSQPGTLQEVMLDMSPTSSTLKITGAINGVDLKYINNGKGKIASFTELDLSEIKLTPSPDVYSSARIGSTGIGMGDISAEFVLSDSCYVDSTYQNTGLGGASICYRYHTNDLSGAFVGNENYKTIILPSQLKQVGIYTFLNSKTNKVVLPSQSRRICHNAFRESEVKQVELPATLEVIEHDAFYNSKVDSLHLPASCHTLGENAFYTSMIRRINLENVTHIGSAAFQYCKSLTRVNLEKLRWISYSAFNQCRLDSVKFGNDTEHIGAYAFNDNKLRSAILPENLKYLGCGAFQYNQKMEMMYIPQTIEYIGANALPHYWAEVNGELEDGIYYVGKIAYSLSEDMQGATTLNFREGTVGIVDNINDNDLIKASLKEIHLPNSLKYIGGYNYLGTFRDCQSLEKVNLPENLEFIGAHTFDNCTNLNIKSLPKNLKFIGERAFANTRLLELRLEDNLRVVMPNAFEDCNSLSSLYVDLPSIPVAEEYCNMNEMENGDFGISRSNSMANFVGVEQVTFSPKVEYVQNNLFDKSPLLRRVVFEEGENSKPLTIGDFAFSDSENLSLGHLPERTVKVGIYAFSSVHFKDSVFHTGNIRVLGNHALYGARGIKTLYVDSIIEDIDYDAFLEMDDLHTVYYYAKDNVFKNYADRPKFNNKNLEKVVIGSNVRLVPREGFSFCKKLTTLVFEPRERSSELLFDESCFHNSQIKHLVLPDCRTAIGAVAFSGNPLESLVLGDGTENIDGAAFGNCPLKSIEVPSTVQAIGSYAFYDYVENLYFHRNPAPKIDHVFTNYDQKVYVPAGSENSYKKIYKNAEVLPLLADSFLLDQTQVHLKQSEKLQMAPLFSVDKNNSCRIRWKSSAPEIVNVDAEGNVTAMAEGKATITASLYYNDTISAQCEIAVDGATGIGDVIDAGTELRLQKIPSGFQIIGAGTDDKVSIYNLDGALIKNTKSKRVSGLAHGNYLVKVGHKVFKVII